MTQQEELAEHYRQLDAQVVKIRGEQSGISQKIDALNLEERPIYPTDEQRAGITEAARRIKSQEQSKSHHGDPTPTYAVVVCGSNNWLSVRHSAPYKHRGGSRLWDFTESETETLLDLLRAEGLTVAHHWVHDEGISIRAHA
jgi:hypothetical protein